MVENLGLMSCDAFEVIFADLERVLLIEGPRKDAVEASEFVGIIRLRWWGYLVTSALTKPTIN
jgi:hypothetical protein